MKKIILLLLLPLMFAWNVNGQQHHTFGTMRSVAQSIQNNPAFVPRYRVTIAMPGANFGTSFRTGISYNEALTNVDGKIVLDATAIESKLKDKNLISNQFHSDLFFLSFQAGPSLHFNFSSSVKTDVNIFYPKGLFTFAAKGNIDNQSIQLSPELKVNTYLETAFGASYVVNDQLTVGARLKFRKGAFGAESKKASFLLETDPNTSISISGDLDLVATNPDQFDSDGTKNEDIESPNFEFNGVSDLLSKLGPTTFGLDVGATYDINEKITVGLSVLDIGAVKYVNVRRISLDPATAKFSYSGIPVTDLVESNELFENVEEDISNAFETKQTVNELETFKVTVPTQFYLNGDYKLSRSITAGATVFGESRNGVFNGSFGVNISKNFGHLLTGSLSFNRMHGTWNNLGAGVSFNLTPFQLYFAGDNLLSMGASSLGNSFNPSNFLKNAEHINFRFGMNLVFGWKKDQVELTDNIWK